jgi:lactate dehydrogenase-like 2-hydroxyacid dehydrogenase
LQPKPAVFDKEVHYYNRSSVPDDQAHGAIYHDSVVSLLGVVNFLSRHCPATAETTNLMNAERFALLPHHGAVVVNSARGALIDEIALIAAIDAGQVAAAGLDYFQTEPGGNSAFSGYDKIFMLPQIGSATKQTRDAMGFRALDNLDAFFAGQKPCDTL